MSRYRPGDVVREPQFTSSSVNPRNSHHTPSERVHFAAKSKRGKYIAPWSGVPEEVEVLFPADALFRVKDVVGRTIYLEEID